ncbi:MAG: hypothetical protein CME63_08195 [Halobacteriovoraceae bacterium]|nr:hypothetical protein [Halobacteriovoraceae bacterium]MBC97715.1 hypothetical protein [Halobacteriovoraceae bacterium]
MSNSRSFILKCSMCFKVFDYHVTMTESKASVWNFVTTSPRTNKKYAVFCTPSVNKVKGLIKVALKKLPTEHRLVVVSLKHNEDELKFAEEQDYCLVTYETLNDFGQQMLEIKNQDFGNSVSLLDVAQSQASRDNEENKENPSDFIDKVIKKDRLF